MMTIEIETLLTRWNFPKAIVSKYKLLGISQIFEWQFDCFSISKVVDEKQNFVYSAPTSAGKTLVAELLMLKNVLDNKKKAILILPFVSLAKEKLKHLQWLTSDYDLTVDGFIGSSSPSGGFASVDIAVCTIEKANSLINRLIEDDQLDDLGILVVDELHMIGDSSRGYLLELILSKIKFIISSAKEKRSSIQIVGMSATISNLDLIAKWLDASFYETTFRPIDLNECIKYEDKLFDKNHQLVDRIRMDPRIDNDPDHLIHLVYETIRQKLGVLLFCPTKSRCETLAENIARAIYNLEKNHGEKLEFLDKQKLVDALNELKETPAGLDSQLAKCLRYGISFHHAGLTVEEREVLEKYFKQSVILVIVCTSTLSSGINFPARRVIIRTPIFNGKTIDAMSYRQMVGRAGRKGVDTVGESILMCANANEKKAAEMLVNAQLPDLVVTKPNVVDGGGASMRRALLETIVSGVTTTQSDVIAYKSCFLAKSDDLEPCLEWLRSNEFISLVKDNDTAITVYKPTQLGFACVAASMAPDEALLVFGELQKALQCFVLENELHIVYQITPMNICDYWLTSTSSIDWNLFYTMLQNFTADYKRVADLVGVRQSFIVKMIKGSAVVSGAEQSKQLRAHLRFFTALILNDLVNETPFASLLAKYGCQKGFLQTLQQSSATYAHMITTFCNRLGWYNFELLFNQFQSRLLFGVQRQLLDLVRIRLLNSYRARLFYNAGYTTVASVAMCDLKKLEKILRSTLTFVSTKQKAEPEANGNKQEAIIVCEGQSYTYWEASVEIFEEANELVRKDLEVMGVKLKSGDQLKLNKSLNRTFAELNETYDTLMITKRSQASHIVEESPKELKSPQPTCDEPKESKQEASQPKAQSQSTSFLDDQHIIQAAKKFDASFYTPKAINSQQKKHQALNVSKSANPIKNRENNMSGKDLNTTIVSNEILQMCEQLEKNALSGKKESKPKEQQTPNATKKDARKEIFKAINLNETALKSLMMDSQTVEKKKSNAICDDSFRSLLLNSLEKYTQYLNQKVNIVETKDEYERFYLSLKSKSLISIGIACESTLNSNAADELKENDELHAFCYLDPDRNHLVKLYGLFIYSEYDKEKQANLLIQSNRDDSQLLAKYCKMILEREDLIKIVLHAKDHAKTLLKMFDVSMKMPCYDPIIGNWLLCQEKVSIFQIKQKFCPTTFNLPIENSLKTLKTCYGCKLCESSSDNSKQKYSQVDLIANAFVECLIGINCYEKLKYQLQLENLWIYFAKIESEIVLLASQMEFVGLGFNLDVLEQQKCLLIKRKKELEESIFKQIGRQIQLNSPDQVAEVIYDHLRLSLDAGANSVKSADLKFRHHSTSKDVLEQLAAQHTLPRFIILWRKINHTLSNCIYPIEKLKCFHKSINMYRIHSSVDLFNLTGRMSFNEPSLQSVPKEFEVTQENLSELCDANNFSLNKLESNEEGKICFINKLDEDDSPSAANQKSKPKGAANPFGSISLRSTFIPFEDRIYLAADYCQLELRVMANLCKDEALISVFNDPKQDIFKLLASKWLSLPLAEIDDVKRGNVKKIIYGIIYGISPRTLSTFLGIDEVEASNFIESFKSTFPGLKKFISTSIDECKTNGFVESIRKRRRYIPNIFSADIRLRAQAERQAINTIVQGSASDIVKTAMVRIEKTIRKTYSNLNRRFTNDCNLFGASCGTSSPRGAFLVLQMHDELIYEVNRLDLKDIRMIVQDSMENCMNFRVKMKAKVKIGTSWGSLVEMDDD